MCVSITVSSYNNDDDDHDDDDINNFKITMTIIVIK